MTTILSVDARAIDLPLLSPYKLSFTTLEAIRSSIVEIELDDGGKGMGEVTALPGYGDETADTVQSVLGAVVSELQGRSLEQAHAKAEEIYAQHPFATSALGTALDLATGDCIVPGALSIPLSYTTAAQSDVLELVDKVSEAVEHGYRTVKVKVGGDHAIDMASAAALIESDAPVRYRFDANQGYSFAEAREFLGLIRNVEKVDYLEQPFPRGSWDEDAELSREFPGLILLDESIYDEDDVRRAADVGVRLIKMKLAKTRGPSHLLAIARLAKSLGMSVVLGNGVATDVSNLVEAAVFTEEEGLFLGAFEGNGFLKLREQVMHRGLREEKGKMVWGPPGTSGILA